jgi:CSLREA domain-containing protein
MAAARTGRGRLGALAIVLVSLAGLAASPVAGATTIAVNTTTDQYGAGGKCALREAVEAANSDAAFGGCAAGSAVDQVKLRRGIYRLTIPPAGGDFNDSGDLDIGGSLSITRKGGGAVSIDAGGIDRAIQSNGPSLELRNLTIRNGHSPDNGGGILNVLGQLTLERVTLAGNRAEIDGGGLSNYSNASLLNTTISGNRAKGSGGGIQAPGSSATTLRNVTVAGNTADADASGNGEGGGFSAQDTFSTYDTLIGDNADASPDAGDKNPDCYSGPDFFPRFTLIEVFKPATCLVGFNPGSNITGMDPDLGPLRDNGGGTRTRALLGGPALNAGGSSGIDTCATTDQRGLPRALAGQCDLGAYERVACKGLAATRVGGNARDVLRGTPGRDVFALFAGNDEAKGLGGGDVICAGRGSDKLRGGRGRDKLLGGKGRDTLLGGPGRDRLLGGPGRDKLRGGGGKDFEKQ